MKTRILLLLSCFSISFAQAQVDTILWLVDNLSQIDGHNVQILGNPQVINTEFGLAVEFDGVDDGLIVDNNPVAGASAFTIEIIFKPYSGGAVEQRFLHMQQDNDNRLLIELRNPADENWSLDTFIKSGSSSQALLDYSYVHDLDQWAHAALVYKDGVMEHFVDGEKELEGTVEYQVVNSGETSLGVRLNQVHWFKGAILAVRVTHDALEPEGFLDMDLISNINQIPESELSSRIIPNPIVSNGVLQYQLEAAANISIDLFNSNGEKVLPLFSGFKNKGTHELEIKGDHLPAGSYFIVIENGTTRRTEQCLFVR